MLLEKVSLPKISKGPWKIEHFTVDRPDFHSMMRGRNIPIGEKFTRLLKNDTLIMSDTPAEMNDHYNAVLKSKGSCLLNGLGIGMVLKAILKKNEVTDITVIEISQDLIDVISPYYNDTRIKFICDDAFNYKPPKEKKYQMVWHDIWNEICSDNLFEMHKLHRKYGRISEWQGSWARYECEKQR